MNMKKILITSCILLSLLSLIGLICSLFSENYIAAIWAGNAMVANIHLIMVYLWD